MRQFCLCLFAGLLALAFLHSGAMADHSGEPGECCFEYYKRRIPLSKIDSYNETRENCNKPGVVLVTKKHVRVCVDPRVGWVRNAMQSIDDQRM